ncbi:MAG: DUF2029 domain-containing protein [Phycisphaerales bacterium]|nr:MAG: DUF2029 domain-containing protein [Phycisphaerales bacterium]
MIGRGADLKSDIGCFYSATTQLNNGIGGDLYTLPDPATGWPMCMSVPGLVIFQPLSLLSPFLAATIWAVFNLALLAVSVVLLCKFLDRLDHRWDIYQEALPSAIIILLLLSVGSIQVGQYSVLFVACWILYLYSVAGRRNYLAGILLAIPSAIKLYPAMMLAVPVFCRGNRRGLTKQVLSFVLGVLFLFVIVPRLVYGPRAWELNKSFFQNIIFGGSAKLSQVQSLDTPANQSLDTVMLRYLSHDPAFHSRFPNVPHLHLERGQVLLVAHIVRVLMVLASTGFALLWWRRHDKHSAYAVMAMFALWSATLYVALPEVKARYAIYAFGSFLPLLAVAAQAKARSDRRGHILYSVLVLLCLILVLQFIPVSLQAYGVGFLGAVILWIANLRNIAAGGRGGRAEGAAQAGQTGQTAW